MKFTVVPMNGLGATEQGAALMIFDEKYAAKVETLPGEARLVSISLPTKGAAWGVTISPSFDEIKDMLTKSRKPIRPKRARPATR